MFLFLFSILKYYGADLLRPVQAALGFDKHAADIYEYGVLSLTKNSQSHAIKNAFLGFSLFLHVIGYNLQHYLSKS